MMIPNSNWCARREADQAQVQQTEAAHRVIELQCEALAQKEAELGQRETSFGQARVALDEALAAADLEKLKKARAAKQDATRSAQAAAAQALQKEREILQLRESQAATTAALRQMETRRERQGKDGQSPPVPVSRALRKPK